MSVGIKVTSFQRGDCAATISRGQQSRLARRLTAAGFVAAMAFSPLIVDRRRRGRCGSRIVRQRPYPRDAAPRPARRRTGEDRGPPWRQGQQDHPIRPPRRRPSAQCFRTGGRRVSWPTTPTSSSPSSTRRSPRTSRPTTPISAASGTHEDRRNTAWDTTQGSWRHDRDPGHRRRRHAPGSLRADGAGLELLQQQLQHRRRERPRHLGCGYRGRDEQQRHGRGGDRRKAKIMPIRIADASGTAYWSKIAQGISYAADHGARVASISYEGLLSSSSIISAAQYMSSKGGLVVIAAGNCGCNPGLTPSTSMIPVSATDSQRQVHQLLELRQLRRHVGAWHLHLHDQGRWRLCAGHRHVVFQPHRRWNHRADDVGQPETFEYPDREPAVLDRNRPRRSRPRHLFRPWARECGGCRAGGAGNDDDRRHAAHLPRPSRHPRPT